MWSLPFRNWAIRRNHSLSAPHPLSLPFSLSPFLLLDSVLPMPVMFMNSLGRTASVSPSLCFSQCMMETGFRFSRQEVPSKSAHECGLSLTKKQFDKWDSQADGSSQVQVRGTWDHGIPCCHVWFSELLTRRRILAGVSVILTSNTGNTLVEGKLRSAVIHHLLGALLRSSWPL